jgi:probable rRNA maturation factor
MGVLISNRQKGHKVNLEIVQNKAQIILNALDCPDGELSILLVDDPQIAALNRDYLNRVGPTNVIAFPMHEGDYANISPLLLGDVVISADTASREGGAAGTGFEERLLYLLVHGILHLFGYDHETSAKDAQQMESKTEELLSLITKADG